MRSRLALLATLLVACPPSRAASPVTWTRAPALHRPVGETCAPHRGIAGGAAAPSGGAPPVSRRGAVAGVDEQGRLDGAEESACANDADCRDAPRGYCARWQGKGRSGLRCFHDACLTDAECGGGACACREDRAHGCVPGECKVDQDCGAPGFCAFSRGADVMTRYGRVMDQDRGYFCRTPRDSCLDDDDCVGARCAFVGARRRWECRAVNPSDAP